MEVAEGLGRQLLVWKGHVVNVVSATFGFCGRYDFPERGRTAACREETALKKQKTNNTHTGVDEKRKKETAHKETPITTDSPFYCTQYLFISSFSNSHHLSSAQSALIPTEALDKDL